MAQAGLALLSETVIKTLKHDIKNIFKRFELQNHWMCN